MATGETEIGRRESRLTRLLMPRPVTLVLLAGGGAAAGHALFSYVPYSLVIYLAGLAGPLCMAIAVAAWSMRDKVDATFDPDYLDTEEYARSRGVVRDVRTKSMLLAGACTLCAVVAAGPALSAQLLSAYWHWMVVASATAVGLAGYCFQIAFAWEDQLRAHREKLIVKAKEAEARKQLEDRLSAPGAPLASWGDGWGEPNLDEALRPH